jgi:signal transduction histidine kinase
MSEIKAGTAADKTRLESDARSGAVGLGILASLLVVGFTVVQLFEERSTVLSGEKDSLLRTAELAAIEMRDMLDQIRFFFRAADHWLSTHPRADPRFDANFAALVDEFRSTMKDRIEIRLVSESGDLYYIPSESVVPANNVKDRSYFAAQAEPDTRGFFIAETVMSRITGEWSIPISYPLSSANSGVSVIFAAWGMPAIEELYDKVRPKPGGTVSLVRRDGRILARVPFNASYIGKSIADDADAWWRGTAETEVVVMKATATDSAERIIATKHIDDYGLALNVTAKADDVLAIWRKNLIARAALALGLIAAISIVLIRLLIVLKKLNTAKAELATSIERLRESDSTKDRLLSILGHDLRGPVGGICNLLDTMACDPDGIDRDELMQCILALRKSARNTYQLLENILAWAKSKRGDKPPRLVPTRLRPVVEECVNLYSLWIEEKGLSTLIDVDPGFEARFDPDLFKVVLRNLVSNAVKFSKQNGVIEISSNRSGGVVVLTVRDDGVGMSAETLAGLFSSASAVSRAGTANEKGSGLGLALCKDIIERHGGSIEASSAAGSGSVFTIRLRD